LAHLYLLSWRSKSIVPAARGDRLTDGYGSRRGRSRRPDFTYSLIDRIFRLSLGELADFSGAKYDGDFTLTLEQAQRRKHEYVAGQIGIDPAEASSISAADGGRCSPTSASVAPPGSASPCRRTGEGL